MAALRPARLAILPRPRPPGQWAESPDPFGAFGHRPIGRFEMGFLDGCRPDHGPLHRVDLRYGRLARASDQIAGDTNRMIGARWRELASLLVVSGLLAASMAPAGAASVAGAGSPAASLPSSSLVLSAVRTGSGSTPGDPDPAGRPPGPSDAPVAEPPSPSPTPAPACVRAAPGLKAARVVSRGPHNRRVVALTFDDGYGPVNTLKILAILQQYRVNATFFPVGQAVHAYPSVWRRVVAAGYPIGDHTFDHARLKGLCFSAQLGELVRQQDVVSDVLGVEELPVMRPPYGARDGETALAATAAGDPTIVMWDVDTRDWSGLSAFTIAHRAIVGHSGSIVLMHTFVTATAAALPWIIGHYRARGFTFVTVGQLLGIDGPVPFP